MVFWFNVRIGGGGGGGGGGGDGGVWGGGGGRLGLSLSPLSIECLYEAE